MALPAATSRPATNQPRSVSLPKYQKKRGSNPSSLSHLIQRVKLSPRASANCFFSTSVHLSCGFIKNAWLNLAFLTASISSKTSFAAPSRRAFGRELIEPFG